MHIVSIILQGLLGIAFFMAGMSKITGAKQMVDNFTHLKLPQWFLPVTGIVEILGAAGMIAGIWYANLAVPAGLLIAVTMLGAVLAHIRSQDPANKIVPPAVLFVLALIVTVIHWT